MTTEIHPTAIVETGAQLESGVCVGAFAYIGSDVCLSQNVTVGHHALVEGHTIVGEGTQIYAHAKVGVTPQDLKFKGEAGRLIIGKNNKIRESASIEIGTEGGGMETRLGDNNLMMINAHIAHDGQLGDNIVLGMCAGTAGHVTIGSGVRIASLSGVHQFVRIGEMSYVGLSAIINRDILPFSLIDQNSNLIGLNLTGLRRLDIANQVIREIQNLYDLLCDQSGDTFESRLKVAGKLDLQSDYAKKLLSFAQGETNQGYLLEVFDKKSGSVKK